MVTYDQSEFQLKVLGCEDHLDVMTFRSKDYAISRPYQFEVLMLAEKPLRTETLLNQPAYLSIHEKKSIHGYLRDIIYEGFDTVGFYYRFILTSPLFKLHRQSQSRIFLDVSPMEVLQTLLQTNGFRNDQWLFLVKQPFKKVEMITQYLETDLQFFQRLVSTVGLLYQIQSSEKIYTLILTDQSDRFTGNHIQSISFQTQTGVVLQQSIANFRKKRQALLRGGSRETDQCEQQPTLLFKRAYSAKRHVPILEEAHYDGMGVFGFDQFFSKVKVDQACVDVKRQILNISTQDADFTLGDLVEIESPFERFWTRLFRVISIDYTGAERGGFMQENERARLVAQLTLIPADVPYAIQPPAKKQAGLHLGTVNGLCDDRADLDEYGRYTISYHFSDAQNQSKRLYLSQEFTGHHLGGHCPLHPGTKVVVTYRNGDIDRPMILGGLCTQMSAKNCCQLKTFSGHHLSFQSGQENKTMLLQTADRSQALWFKQRERSSKVSLINRAGSIGVCAARKLKMQTGSDHYQVIGSKHQVAVRQHYRLYTRYGDIILDAADQLKVRTGQSFLISTAKRFQLNSQSDLRLVADHHLQMKTDGQMFLRSKCINLKSGQSLSVQGSRITIKTGSSRLDIFGSAVTFTGTTIQVIGRV
jgi:type VI secretion system secreted protein VgrG